MQPLRAAKKDPLTPFKGNEERRVRIIENYLTRENELRTKTKNKNKQASLK